MNERIEKLFEQALEEFKAENKYATIVVPDTLQRDFVGKFAELIVQKCADIGQQYADGNYEVYNQILEHFGIEEE